MARQENASYEGQRQRSSKQVTALDIYPVGAIFLTMDARNPAEYFGGTWELLAPGRTLICVDTSQDEFNAPGKTGGANGNNYTHAHTTRDHVLTTNEMPAHYHNNGFNVGALCLGVAGSVPNVFASASQNVGFSFQQNGGWYYNFDKGTVYASNYAGGNWGHNHGTVTDTIQYISALQPFMTCYMWKRTA